MGTIERLVLGFLNSAYQDEMMTVPRGTGLAECRHSSRHILLESDLYDGRGYKYQVVGVVAPAYSLCMNLLKLSSYHDGTYPKGWHDRTLTMLGADVGILQVIIIGGGPAGLATALRLKQVLNISSTIFELRPEPVTMGGAVAIPTNGLRLLDRLGLYSQVMAKAAEATDIVLHSSQGAILGRISVVSWSQQMTGFGLVRILRADLMNILLAAADEAAINVVYGADLEGIEETHGRVTALFRGWFESSWRFALRLRWDPLRGAKAARRSYLYAGILRHRKYVLTRGNVETSSHRVFAWRAPHDLDKRRNSGYYACYQIARYDILVLLSSSPNAPWRRPTRWLEGNATKRS